MARSPSRGQKTKKKEKAARISTRSTGSITLGDVARLAGVSPITVSRVLNRPELVTRETIEIVREAIVSTGYVPNLLAGGLASSRSRLIAAIIPTLGNAMFIDTVQALNDRLSESGYQLMMGLSGFPTLCEEDLLKAMLSRRPDAIILTGVHHSEESQKRLRAAKIPVLEIWDFTPSPIDMLVGFSHEKIGKAVANYLLAKGYHRFGLVFANDDRAQLRKSSFLSVIEGQGIHDWLAIDVPSPTSLRTGRETLGRLLAAGQMPQVIVCSSDVVAHGILAEAQSRGLSVPQNLAVMGFGDLDFAAYTFPALSTVRVDRAAIGRRAAEVLLARLEGRPGDAEVIDLGFEVVERAST